MTTNNSKTATFTKRIVYAAATLLVAAGAASAQSMKAEIPFQFRVGSKLMAPGAYRVTTSPSQSGKPFFILTTAGNSVVAMPYTTRTATAAWEKDGNPVLSFTCVAERCALTAVWAGPERPAYTFAVPKLGKDEPARVATIALRPDHGE